MNNVLAKAQKMITDEQWNRDVERAASMQGGKRGSSEDFSAIEESIFGASSGPSTVGYEKTVLPEDVKYQQTDFSGIQRLQEVPEQRDLSQSRLPKAIIESFKKTPSPVEAFSVNGAREAQSEELARVFQQFNGQNKPAQKAPVREQVAQQRSVQQPQYQPQQGGVDYNYIKYLVSEAIKENMKGMLNESAAGGNLAAMKIAPGNKLQFMDTKGNIYEAQLTLKKKKQ